MCGICGIFDLSGAPVDRDLLARMMTTIRHRGPDGEGCFIDREVALGHRRLSIIDLEGGKQPIGNEDGVIQVVFNGEIYNFIELRRELEAAGHQFQTHSDTEVIVHAYEQWGADCVGRFNGMFAFALWDSRDRTLFLARDHLGIKPLYYIRIGQQLLFASEIKALLQHPDCPRVVDIEALAELFTFRYVPSPKTLFSGVMKLPPGHRLKAGRQRLKIDRYWVFVPKTMIRGKESDLTETYQALLEDTVKLQMRSDVPVGLFLSSGVDSGMLLALMSRQSSHPVQCFTIGFEGGEITNEMDDARAMASRFGAQHEVQVLGPQDYTRYYERYMSDLEEPVGNETAAAFYFLSKLTSRRVKVALSGQGADEPWAGYDRHKGAKLSSLYSRLPRFSTEAFGRVIKALPGRMERLKRGVDALAEPDSLTRLTRAYSFFSADLKAQLYRGPLRESFRADPYGPRQVLGRLHRDVAHLTPLEQMLYLDTRTNLPDDLLMVGDKTSMACSIESRVPFLDIRLVEFTESLPSHLRLRGMTGKYLHKKAALKWLPREIVYRPKKGFANPIEHWFRVGMKPFVEDCLLGSGSSVHAYFDRSVLERLLREDQLGHEQYRRHIYLLVSLELWHRTFIKR